MLYHHPEKQVVTHFLLQKPQAYNTLMIPIADECDTKFLHAFEISVTKRSRKHCSSQHYIYIYPLRMLFIATPFTESIGIMYSGKNKH